MDLISVMRQLVRAIGGLFFLCFVVAAVGYAVGPDPGVESAPTVDTDERPSEVVADASAQLWVRDHTWKQWLRERNRTSGAVREGILFRVRVQHSRDRFRITQWHFPDEPNETVDTTDQPSRYGYSRRHAAWGRFPNGNEWHRYSGIEPVYGPKSSAAIYVTPQLRNASMTVVSENATTLVVRTSDEKALSALQVNYEHGEVSVTFVVAKTENPYLARYTVRHVTDEEVETRTTFVSDVGTTTAPEPDGVPSVTSMEVIRRTVFGVESLVT